MQRVAAKPVNVLRTSAVVVGAGATATLQPRVACQGFQRLVGGIVFATAPTPAAGYPRVAQYDDQATSANPSQVDQLAGVVNPDGVTVTYDINVDIHHPYLAIQYVDGGAGVTINRAQAELRGSN